MLLAQELIQAIPDVGHLVANNPDSSQHCSRELDPLRTISNSVCPRQRMRPSTGAAAPPAHRGQAGLWSRKGATIGSHLRRLGRGATAAGGLCCARLTRCRWPRYECAYSVSLWKSLEPKLRPLLLLRIETARGFQNSVDSTPG